jgi:hypothetical protein
MLHVTHDNEYLALQTMHYDAATLSTALAAVMIALPAGAAQPLPRALPMAHLGEHASAARR